MSSNRNFGVDEDSENCADIANNDFLDIFKSDSHSSTKFPARKRCKRLVIEDDTDDQDRIN